MFKNKVAVITGAGSGIGRALALLLGGHGARLALSDINTAGLDETLALLKNAGQPEGSARAYVVNVASAEAVFAHADEVKRDFGTAHYVFNNAGATIVGTVNTPQSRSLNGSWGSICGVFCMAPKPFCR